MPLYERAALYSIADCAVVTATRDGMNLVPYEYVVCRQGVPVSGHPADASCMHCTVLPHIPNKHQEAMQTVLEGLTPVQRSLTRV